MNNRRINKRLAGEIMNLKKVSWGLSLCLILVATLVFNGYAKQQSAEKTETDSRKYLVFELTNIRLKDPVCDVNEAVVHLASQLGANNPSSDKMYAFGLHAMPLLTRSVEVLKDQVDLVFDIAEKHDVPVYLHIDPMYGFGMEDIPAGVEPALRFWEYPEMCEWVNFPEAGQTNGQIPRCWVNWGRWLKVSNALPNYESPELKKFYKSQLEDGVLKPIKKRLLALEKKEKGYLFAGLNIGWETRFQDKSDLAGQAITNSFNTTEIMQEWEQTKSGYAALHTKGWDDASLSAEAVAKGISKDQLFYNLCGESIRDNMKMLAKTACEYGFTKDQIYSHIVAIETYYDDDILKNNLENPPPVTQ